MDKKHFQRLILVFVFLISLGSITSNAQQGKITSGVEKTILGLQFGGAVGYEFKNLMAVEIFFQKTVNKLSENVHQNYEFAGLQISYPIAKSDRLILSPGIRTGLSNRRFLVIAPIVETQFMFTQHLGVSLGLGIRAREASIWSRLVIKL